MHLPGPGLGETHFLSKHCRFASEKRHLCSKTSYFTVGALSVRLHIEKSFQNFNETQILTCARKPYFLQWVRSLLFFSFVKTHTSLTPSWKTNVLNAKSIMFYGGCAFFCLMYYF